jgi:hypothetical protein
MKRLKSKTDRVFQEKKSLLEDVQSLSTSLPLRELALLAGRSEPEFRVFMRKKGIPSVGYASSFYKFDLVAEVLARYGNVLHHQVLDEFFPSVSWRNIVERYGFVASLKLKTYNEVLMLFRYSGLLPLDELQKCFGATRAEKKFVNKKKKNLFPILHGLPEDEAEKFVCGVKKKNCPVVLTSYGEPLRLWVDIYRYRRPNLDPLLKKIFHELLQIQWQLLGPTPHSFLRKVGVYKRLPTKEFVCWLPRK